MYSSAVLIEVVFTPHLKKMQKYSCATPILEALYLGIRLSRIKRHIHKALKPFYELVNEAPNHGGRETADLSNVHVPLGLSIWLPTLPRLGTGAHQDYWLQCQHCSIIRSQTKKESHQSSTWHATWKRPDIPGLKMEPRAIPWKWCSVCEL